MSIYIFLHAINYLYIFCYSAYNYNILVHLHCNDYRYSAKKTMKTEQTQNWLHKILNMGARYCQKIEEYLSTCTMCTAKIYSIH